MKIFTHIPENNEENKAGRSIDSPLIPSVRIGKEFMLWVSAFTVCVGIYYQFGEAVFQYGHIWGWLILACVLLAWGFGVDNVNSKMAGWVTRSLLNIREIKGTKSIITTVILISFCGFACYHLTNWSRDLSMFSAEKSGMELSGDAKERDTEKQTKDNQEFINAQLARFDKDYSKKEESFRAQIEALEKPYKTKIKVYEGYIKNAEKEKTGTVLQAYINRQTNNIAWQENKMSAATKAKVLERDTTLAAITAAKETERRRLVAIADQERAAALSSNEASREEHTKFETQFSNLFGIVAGYAIFGVLLLTVILEILLDRAGITYTPVFENIDYYRSYVAEFLAFPFEWIGRHVINTIRGWKEALPDLREPDKESTLAGYEARIIPFDGTKAAAPAGSGGNSFMSGAYQKNTIGFQQSGTAKFQGTLPHGIAGYMETENRQIGFLGGNLTHEPQTTNPPQKRKPTNKPRFKEPTEFPVNLVDFKPPAPRDIDSTLDLWQLKQKLKKYKKNVGSFYQQCLAQQKRGEPITQRKLDALINNRAWELGLIKRINELEAMRGK